MRSGGGRRRRFPCSTYRSSRPSRPLRIRQPITHPTGHAKNRLSRARATIAPQIRLRRPGFDHELVEHLHTSPEEAAPRLAGAAIAIVNKVRLDAETLARLPDLRLVAVAATGTDCVDKAYCRQRRIAVANIREYAIHTVPEHAFALILALRRSISCLPR